MNEIERYLCEEIAIDHADGLITRRDALHRLAWNKALEWYGRYLG